MNLTKGLGAKVGGNGIPKHDEPEFIKKIDFNNKEEVKNEILKFENNSIDKIIETACVITKNGEIYYCYGVEDISYC